MKTIQSLTALKGYLNTQSGNSRPRPSDQTFPAITVTRQCGARGVPIVNKLLEDLQGTQLEDCPPWILFENELILRVLRDNNLPETLAKFFPENPKHSIAETVEEIMGLHPSSYVINQKCNQLIRSLCRVGHCIIIGRAGNFATKGMPNVFNVRLVGSKKQRLAHLRERLHLTEKDAKTYLEEKDNLCQGYAKDTFDIADLNDPTHYDLVLNTDHISDGAAIDAIKLLMRSKTEQPNLEYA